MVPVKTKVFLGYFTVVALSSLMIWVIYSEVLRSSKKMTSPKPFNKVMYINSILSNLYLAENLERIYAQTGNIKHYKDYLRLMDTIHAQVDSLKHMTNSPIQQKNIDRIKILLQNKQVNLKEFVSIKRSRSKKSLLYRKAVQKLISEKDSVNHYLKVYKRIINHYDSTYIKPQKRKFFKRLADVFTPEKNDSILKVEYNKSIETDCLIIKANNSDTIKKLGSKVITEMQGERMIMESRLALKEQELLVNDSTINQQLKKMVSEVGKKALVSSFLTIKSHQERIEKITRLIILLGILALATIIYFLIHILKDISRSQEYRKNLEEARNFSESLLRSKEQLMLSLTHDLKSPVNSIIGYSEMVNKEIENPQQKHYLQNIQKASGHIMRLINDLFDLARLDSGKLDIVSKPFCLDSLLRDVTESIRPQALSKEIELELQTEIPSTSWYISDPVRITQILVNLISNAVKFTEKGKVNVVASLGQSSDDLTDNIYIEIIDTGIGISEEDISLIFEEFGRVSSVKKKYEGFGLGLAITRKLVGLLNGSLHVKSTPRKGSHFTVYLPLLKDNGQNKLIAIQSRKPDRKFKNMTGERVWLIDDDLTLLDMTTTILKSANMKVTSFSNPKEAVKWFEKGCADLLITDIQMPGMDGFELLKKIMGKNEAPIRAIAISGNKDDDGDYSMFSDFIQKPFTPDELLEAVSGSVLEEGQQAVPEASINQGYYSLRMFRAFASDDPEKLRHILVSFVTTSKQNIVFFKKYLRERNRDGLSELSHKMLTLFRQLEAGEIVELLTILKRKTIAESEPDNYFDTGEKALKKIEELINMIQHDENINSE